MAPGKERRSQSRSALNQQRKNTSTLQLHERFIDVMSCQLFDAKVCKVWRKPRRWCCDQDHRNFFRCLRETAFCRQARRAIENNSKRLNSRRRLCSRCELWIVRDGGLSSDSNCVGCCAQALHRVTRLSTSQPSAVAPGSCDRSVERQRELESDPRSV